MSDDRVCMHYVVEQLSLILASRNLGDERKLVEEFKRECLYNLGVNSHNKYKRPDVDTVKKVRGV